MKCILGLIFSLGFLLITPSFVYATDYYVSTNGNDNNNGSINNPFKTIQKGIDMTIAGDTVKVLPGEYIQSDNYIYGQIGQFIDKHGTPDHYIVLEAADPQQKPIIRGYSGIRVLASSYIKISGFSIQDFTRSGLPVYLSDHITIENNDFSLRFDHLCTLEENQQGLCSYYPTLGIGDIVGRVDKNGQPIKEHDGSQNTGVYFCKSIDSLITENTFANLDESIYIGKAGNIGSDDCWNPNHAIPNRLYNEHITIQGNFIENSWNEAIELKPDTRFNLISGNITKSTRRAIELSQIEIRGHDNEITGNLVVGASQNGIRIISESVADPGPDRVERYKKADGSYMCAYQNIIHNNYVYYWAQFVPSALAIDLGSSSAANTAAHNTLVGTLDYPGKVNEYDSLKANSFPDTVISDNLMVGLRRVDYTPGSEKYEGHLTAYTNYLPLQSDYNAYFPRLKTNNTSCVVSLDNLGIVCQNNNAHNQSVGYEYHSQFLTANPILSDDSLCTKDQLLTIPITQLSDRIQYCSAPLPGSVIIGSASDGTNIGAYQSTTTPTPTSTSSPTPSPKLGDANNDNIVDWTDYQIWLSHYNTNTQNGYLDGDFNGNGKVAGIDYIIWLINFQL